MIKIRAFRAVDDHDACRKFIMGHTHVLENIGVKRVTSSKDEWMYNPASFVIIVESEPGELSRCRLKKRQVILIKKYLML